METAVEKRGVSKLEAIIWAGVSIQEVVRCTLRELYKGVPAPSAEIGSYTENFGDLTVGFNAGLLSRVFFYRALEYVTTKAAPASKAYRAARFLMNEHILNAASLAFSIGTVEVAENTVLFDWINTRDPNDVAPGIAGAVAFAAVRYAQYMRSNANKHKSAVSLPT